MYDIAAEGTHKHASHGHSGTRHLLLSVDAAPGSVHYPRHACAPTVARPLGSDVSECGCGSAGKPGASPRTRLRRRSILLVSVGGLTTPTRVVGASLACAPWVRGGYVARSQPAHSALPSSPPSARGSRAGPTPLERARLRRGTMRSALGMWGCGVPPSMCSVWIRWRGYGKSSSRQTRPPLPVGGASS